MDSSQANEDELFHGELVDGSGLVGFSRTEDGAGEAGLVWTVWVVLGFQAEATAV